MATYPTGIYVYANRSGTDTLAAGTHSTIHNTDAGEIIALETELGTNVKGIYPTVRDRLEGIEASVGTVHTQNTDLGSSSATFYLNGASGAKIKEIGGAFAVRDNADAVYVDFTCDDLTCATINGLTAAQLAALQTNTHTHVNYALIQTYTQTEVDLADAVTKKHTQNTDTGTNVETFQLNNVNPLNSARLKVDDLTPTIVDIRNAADSAFAPIRALEFRGVLQANNADVNRPAIQYNEGTNTWQMANDGLSFVDISQGLSMAGGQGEIQFNNTVNLGADPTFYYNDTTNTLYITNLNVSGTIIGALGSTNLTGTTNVSFEIESDGNGLLITCVGMANDRTVNGEDIYQAIQNSHVPATILDTASINFGISGQEITGSVLPGGVDHDSLLNFSANEHVDHTGVSISAGTGLTGGGDISANRTLSLSHLGIQNLTDPGADRIMFWDESSNFVTWLQVSTGLSTTGTTLTLDHLGIEDLTDPGAHRLMAWDDTDNLVQWVTVGTGLTYTHATHTLSATGTVTDLDSAYNGGNTIDCDTSPVTITVSDTDNNRALDVVQNDVTNDPAAMQVTNSTTGPGVILNATGSGPHLNFIGDPTVVTPVDGDLWYTGTSLNFYNGATTKDLLAGGGATGTRGTFTNASLTAGVLTITHSQALATPFTLLLAVADNSQKQIIPDEVTFFTNTITVNLSSYVTAGGGSIAGTWGYYFI